MERIVQGRSATLTHTFYVDGVPTNPTPDTATVTITRANGTALVPTGSVVDGGVGIVSLTLIPAETALLDTLKLTWAASFGGQSQSFVEYVEVCGGFLFTVAQAKAIPGLTTQSSANIVEARTMVETALEDACARAFVPRYSFETFDGSGSSGLLLSWPDLRVVRSVTVAGVAYTSAELALVAMRPTGLLHNNGSYWTAGSGTITVGYEHGMPYARPEITRAALILTKSWLGGQNRPIDDRAITFNATEGGTYSLAVPGRNGSVFGHPDVDSVVQRWSLVAGVA